MPHINAGSKMEFANNSLKSPKIGKLNIATLIIPQGLLIHEKTRVQKYHAALNSAATVLTAGNLYFSGNKLLYVLCLLS